MEISLTTSPVRITTVNPHGGSNNVQKATIIIHPGSVTRAVTFPAWKVLSETGNSILPTTILALTTMVVNLEILGNGGDTNTLARFLSYKD
jgi:hypothetical protein